jgi:heterodisulfide reductase subunit A-like polyferredoxin
LHYQYGNYSNGDLRDDFNCNQSNHPGRGRRDRRHHCGVGSAECGKQVILVERNATLGGRTALLYRYFPKNCHSTCGLEINLRRLKGNRNVRVMTMTEVVGVTGQRGDYTVKLKIAPRYVNANCTACGDCAAAIETQIDNPYEYDAEMIVTPCQLCQANVEIYQSEINKRKALSWRCRWYITHS